MTSFNVFILTLALMLQEISLIRISDIFYWPGATFFVIAIFSISFGVSGYFSGRHLNLPHINLAQCLCFPACYFSIVVFQNEYIPFWLGSFFLPIPFLLGGYAVTGSLTLSRDKIGSVYFWDLLGLAFGGLVGLFVLPFFGPVVVVYLTAIVLSAGSLIVFYRKVSLRIVNFLSVILLGFSFFTLDNGNTLLPRMDKYLSNDIKPFHIEYSSWNPMVKIDIVDPGRTKKSEKIHMQSSKKDLFYDGGTLGTIIYNFDGDYETLKNSYLVDPSRHFLDLSVVASHYLKQSLGYSAFIVGSGAGQEVKAGLLFGADRIVANELVPEVLKLGKTTYSKYNGGIFLNPKVEAISGDGRIVLGKLGESFDVIQIFSNYLSSTIARGRGFFSVSFLLTEEAFLEYFNSLKADGILQINHHGRDLLIQTAKKAWEKLFKSEFDKHVVRIEKADETKFISAVLIKKSPWSDSELDQLKDLFGKHPSEKFLVLKGGEYQKNYKILPTDDRPFFSRIFEVGRDHPFNYIIQKFSFALLLILLLVLGFSSRPVSLLSERLFFTLIGSSFAVLILSMDKILLKYIEYPHYVHILSICLLPVFMGLGSLFSSKITAQIQRVWVFLCPVVVLLFACSYQNLFVLFESTDLFLRMGLFGVLLFIIGIALGPFFPLGLKKSKSMHLNWICNGLGAAVGSFFCEWLQYQWGIQSALVLCSALYGLAALLILRRTW